MNIIDRIFMITILWLLILPAASYSLSDGIDMIMEDVSPQPVEPGRDFTVKISVYNPKTNPEDVSIKLLEEYPFILKSLDQNLEETFSLCGGCKRINTYYLIVDHKAVSGIYKLRLLLNQSSDVAIKEEIDVRIEGKPNVIFEIKRITGEIIPDGKFDVVLDLKNEGTGVARDIRLITSFRDFPADGGSHKFAGEMAPDESKQITLTFTVGNSIQEDVNSIPVALEYTDSEGKEYASTQNINVKRINRAELSIKEVKIEPSIIKPGDEVTIRVRIENTGKGDAKNVKLLLESEIQGKKDAYLGRLEKDDDSPAFFTGKVLTEGDKADVLIVTYEDDLGEHSQRENIRYTVRGVSDESIIISGLIIVILGLLAALAFFWIYKRCRCYLEERDCKKKKTIDRK